MTANERYEKAWDSFLVYLNRNPKATLSPFLKERHVNHRTMMNWMIWERDWLIGRKYNIAKRVYTPPFYRGI